jgi:uncharacterized protein
MLIVKDPLYGFISIEEPFKSLIETNYFQRLRNIKQLGQSYLIYPSANHTRFEHSIGAFFLAGKAVENYDIKNSKEFKAATLLHDVGHYPFSHSIETTIKQISGKGHEKQSIDLIKNTKIADILEKAGLNVDLVCSLIEGRGKFANLISGQVDVDRLDYLRRDSYYTGVAYGVVESDLILRNISVRDNDYIVEMKYLPAIESVLIARYLMFSMVYMHHRTIAANTMLRSAFVAALDSKEIIADDLIKFDDIDLISRLRSSKTIASSMVRLINTRELYREAVTFKKEDFESLEKIENIENIREIEKKISQDLRIENHEILINIQGFPKHKSSRILIGPPFKNLDEISLLVNSLNSAEWNHWFVGIYCPEKYVKKVESKRDMIKSYLA